MNKKNNFLNYYCINNLICAKLFNFAFNINNILQTIIKNQIIYKSCNKLNSYISYISNKKRNFNKVYNKNFFKAFQEKTKINTKNYFLYC